MPLSFAHSRAPSPTKNLNKINISWLIYDKRRRACKSAKTKDTKKKL